MVILTDDSHEISLFSKIMKYFIIFVVCCSCEACIGVLGIQDICHFTSRDIGYFPFYFQGYGILCLIFGFLSGILNSLEN